MTTETQTKMVRNHLEMGLRITGKKAFSQFGIMHLPRRIKDLKEAGYPIADRWINVTKANGDTARVKEWRKA